MNTKLLEKANKAIRNCSEASFAVIDEEGYPSASTVSLIGPENISTLYFSTNIGSNKEKRLQGSSKASLCCRVGDNNITLVGEAEVFTDQETKSKYWQNWFIDVYPGGEIDPTYCVIQFTTKRVSLWIDCAGAEFLL